MCSDKYFASKFLVNSIATVMRAATPNKTNNTEL